MPFRAFGYAVWPGIPAVFRAKKTQGMEGDFACTGGEGTKDLAENGEADTDGMTLLLLRSAATHLGYAKESVGDASEFFLAHQLEQANRVPGSRKQQGVYAS
jgi:hypothetical protein